MGKTFYSVTYHAWGVNIANTAWFGNKAEATAFSNHDYRDDVVAHHVSNPDTIKIYERYVAEESI